jgi:hypothetical protein
MGAGSYRENDYLRTDEGTNAMCWSEERRGAEILGDPSEELMG